MIKLKQVGTVLLAVWCGALLQSCAGVSGQSVHPDDCPGANSGIIPININYERDPINVTGPRHTVYEGDVLRFNLVGADNKLVSTSGKNAEAGWLNGSGKKKSGKANSDRFYICVPTDLFEGEPDTVTKKEYLYNVDAEGRDRLDPVVPVRRLN
ncbi:MAG TPA: hypothetical protein VLS87_03060 [Woeseiaceae bacterium]|nr:hypothetical protein [Woeseiaceae bacterium]